jgi:hypothetical protein
MTTSTSFSPSRTVSVPASRRRIFAIGNGLTTLAIFLQSVTAGQFVSQDHKDGWIDIHGAVADAAWGFALLTAVYALIVLRRANPRLTVLSVVLFVLALVETGIGHLITDLHQDGWIGVHVPLALLLFGLTVWMSIRSARAATAE